MAWLSVAVALLLPWVTAALWLRLVWREPVPGRWPMLIGYGYLLGALLTTLLLYLTGKVGLRLEVWPALSLFSLFLIGISWLLWRSRSGSLSQLGANPDAGGSGSIAQPLPAWQWLLFGLLSLWLLARLLGLALEVWWQPLVPWDAWTTWAVRARVWTELQALAPFIAPQQWLAEPDAASYTIDASEYPVTVSLIAAWPALAYGAWHESAANLPWVGCALALGLGFYGQARRWGASPLVSLLFVWLLFSLPLLSAHIALAGYADLWLATLLAFALMAFLHWARGRDWRQGVLALALILAMPLIKEEGAVWAGLFLPALLAVWTRGRWWLMFGLLAAVLGLLAWIAGGTKITLFGLGGFRVGPQLLLLPDLGEFNFSYQGNWKPVASHLFWRSSWHLLNYALVLALIAALLRGLQSGASEPWFRAGLAWVLSALSAFYVLFFWTDAAEWALRGTSINRILLQFAPALLFWMLTLWMLLSCKRRPLESRTEEPALNRWLGLASLRTGR